MKIFIKLLTGFLFSGVCLLLLFYYTDISTLKKTLLNVNYSYFVPFVICSILAQIFIGIRYYFFMEKKMKCPQATAISILGNSANLILPLRGGELIKSYLSQQHTSIGYTNILSRIFLERILDLFMAIAIGTISILFMQLNMKKIFDNNVIQGLLLLLIASLFVIPTLFYLLKKNINVVIYILKKILSTIYKKNLFENKIAFELKALSQFLSWRNLAWPILLSFFIWFFLHSSTYWSIGLALNLNLKIQEVFFLVLSGTIGLLIPSSPSGIGAIHASISSGLLLLGYPLEKSLAYAILYHFCMFVSVASLGCIAWLYPTNPAKR